MTKKQTEEQAELTANEEATEQTFLLKQVGKQPEQRNIYEHQMSSTETALLSPDDFWKLKLIS